MARFNPRPGPPLRHRPHRFIRSTDPQVCITCPLPPGNRIHDVEEDGALDVQALRAGEREPVAA